MKLFLNILVGIILALTLNSCQNSANNSKDTPSTEIAISEAIQTLNAEITKAPKNASLYFKRGINYRLENQDSMAMIDFKKAIALDSTKANYYSALGDLLFDHKDISGSLGYIKKAIDLDPTDEVAHLKMAKLFLFTEEYPKAFIEINSVLRKNVYNAEAYFLKGMCYKYMKDTTKAISSFQTAVQTEPKYVDAHMQLALIFEAKKNPMALNYFENAYTADTSNIEPLYGKAMYWQKQDNFKEAKKIFTRMISLDRNYPKSFYNMGWMLMQEDSTDKAIRQFDIAIQVQPDYAEAYYNRGICNEILGDFEKAKNDYEQAQTFNSKLDGIQNAIDRLQQKTKK